MHRTFSQNYLTPRENRKEGNDQESIQLPKPFCPRHQRKRRTHLKQRHHNQNILQAESQKDSFFPKIGQMAMQKKKKKKKKNITRTYMRKLTMTETVTTLERSVKILEGVCVCGGGGILSLSLSSAVIYSRHLFSLCEWQLILVPCGGGRTSHRTLP